MILRLASAFGLSVVVVASMACGQADPGPAPSGAPAPTQAAEQAAAPKSGAPAEMVAEIKVPDGWTKSTSGAWVVWSSEDKRAQIALSSLDDPSAAEAKQAELPAVLGVTNVRLNKLQRAVIGPEAAEAMTGDGAAHFASGEGGVAFAVIDVHAASRAVIAYAFDKDATADARKQVMEAVASIKKK